MEERSAVLRAELGTRSYFVTPRTEAHAFLFAFPHRRPAARAADRRSIESRR